MTGWNRIMSRINTTTWVDCKVLVKLMGELHNELITYQMYAGPDTEVLGSGQAGGDRGVIVACINLRKRLKEVVEKSNALHN
mgnify:CR=1 FL=1